MSFSQCVPGRNCKKTLTNLFSWKQIAFFNVCSLFTYFCALIICLPVYNVHSSLLWGKKIKCKMKPCTLSHISQWCCTQVNVSHTTEAVNERTSIWHSKWYVWYLTATESSDKGKIMHWSPLTMKHAAFLCMNISSDLSKM